MSSTESFDELEQKIQAQVEEALSEVREEFLARLESTSGRLDEIVDSEMVTAREQAASAATAEFEEAKAAAIAGALEAKEAEFAEVLAAKETEFGEALSRAFIAVVGHVEPRPVVADQWLVRDPVLEVVELQHDASVVDPIIRHRIGRAGKHDLLQVATVGLHAV